MGLVRRRHKCREKTEAGTKKGSTISHSAHTPHLRVMSTKTSHASAVCV